MERLNAKGQSRQRGAALLVIFISMALIAASLFVTTLTRATLSMANDKQTAVALAQAKEALIGYAVTYYETHPGQFGLLPCPRFAPAALPFGEGNTQLSCGSKDVNSLGRLPWRTLGFPPLRDGSGECLWYAVAGSYKNSGAASPDMLNEDSNGMMEIFASDGVTKVAGNTPSTRPVAAVFAPGAALDGQDRAALSSEVETCGGNYNAANYLDSALGTNNADLTGSGDALDAFILGIVKDANEGIIANDKVIFITREDIFAAIRKRNDFDGKMRNLTTAIAQCVAHYGNHNSDEEDKHLPWPAQLELPNYRVDGQYVDYQPLLYGRLPNIVGSSLRSANLITACPLLNAEQVQLWRHWKDHFFYALAPAHKPNPLASGTQPCTTISCLGLNGEVYAAIVIFSGSRLQALNQTRNSPPADSDEKKTISNYLEGANAIANPPLNNVFQSGSAIANFNDVLACVKQGDDVDDDPLIVVSC